MDSRMMNERMGGWMDRCEQRWGGVKRLGFVVVVVVVVVAVSSRREIGE